jgi:phosphonate transport system substrate-binding protein
MSALTASGPVRPARPHRRPPALRSLAVYSSARRSLAAAISVATVLAAGCRSADSGGAAEPAPVLRIGGIPDQDVSRLERIFSLTASYLSRRTGLKVEYLPSNDYAALVSAFQRGDIQLAWFGGLTGVQAHEVTPGSHAVVQRPHDAEFHSVFIVGPGVRAKTLADLKGKSFTFGSESSTSGHLMPRYFLGEAGVRADSDFAGAPGYSGSHDATYKLVESGAFQAGALNEAVWDAAVAAKRVDTTKVKVLLRTPPFFDYHWAMRGDVDQRFGAGASEKITAALLGLDRSLGADEAELLDLFATDRFVPTADSSYAAIRTVAQGLGILR